LEAGEVSEYLGKRMCSYRERREGVSSRFHQELRYKKRKEQEAMGETLEGYEERKRKREADKQLARCCIRRIDEMNPEEYRDFLSRLYRETGATVSDLIQLRAQVYLDKQSDPDEIRDDEWEEFASD
jgi:hypothetical protein